MAGNVQKKLTMGIHPLSYLGVNAESPPNSVLLQNQDPTSSDWQNFIIGDIWINENGSPNPPNPRIWMLGALARQSATWILIASGGAGDVTTLTGNSGGPVSPLLGNINVVGDTTTINVVGNPATHTLTISAVGTGVVSSFVTDNGTATPIAGVIDLFAQPQAGSSIKFSASTNVIRLNTSDALSNTIIGDAAGNGTLTGSSNVALGVNVLNALTSGSNNTSIGWSSQNLLTSGSNNVSLGSAVLAGITTGSNNIGIGTSAASAYVTGTESSNIIIGNIGVNGESNQIKIGTFGSGAGQQNATFLYGGDVNIPNGRVVMPTTTSTVGQIVIGANRFLHGFGTANTFVGNASGDFSLTVISAVANTACGNATLPVLTTGANNSAFGSVSGNAITTGSNNALVGLGSGAYITTGSNNTGIGSGVFTTGVFPAGGGVVTGSNNIGIGLDAGSAYTNAESNNIVIGNPGVVGESNVLRIGNRTGTGVSKCFISGIAGVTTGAADAIPVLVSQTTDQLGTVSSSKRYKQNIHDMDDQSEIIYDLKPRTFNFKKFPDAPAWGLIAEEVELVFPQLVVYDKDGNAETVKYHELVPLLLNEVQKLNKRIKMLEDDKCK